MNTNCIEVGIDLARVPVAALELFGAVAHAKRSTLPALYCRIDDQVVAELQRRAWGGGDAAPLTWPELALDDIVELGCEAAEFQVAARKAADDELDPGAETWAAVAALLDEVVAAFAAAELAERDGLWPVREVH